MSQRTVKLAHSCSSLCVSSSLPWPMDGPPLRTSSTGWGDEQPGAGGFQWSQQLEQQLGASGAHLTFQPLPPLTTGATAAPWPAPPASPSAGSQGTSRMAFSPATTFGDESQQQHHHQQQQVDVGRLSRDSLSAGLTGGEEDEGPPAAAPGPPVRAAAARAGEFKCACCKLNPQAPGSSSRSGLCAACTRREVVAGLRFVRCGRCKAEMLESTYQAHLKQNVVVIDPATGLKAAGRCRDFPREVSGRSTSCGCARL